MSEFNERLARLGLSQYFEAFAAEGFDTWETLLDVTESDLTTLNVRLGHRRKLQRAIAEWRGQSIATPLAVARRKGSVDESNRSDESGTETKPSKSRDPAAGSAPPVNAKRKYRRHPKPDENAPERPASAYVIFSNQVRETLKGQDLSFADIAKIVGERWQVLSPESREACDKQAATAKEKYYQELAEYKKTPEYTRYQAYLTDFKQKHANQTGGGEGKRSKLETEVSISSTQSGASAFEKSERPAGRSLDVASGSRSTAHHRSLSTEGYDSGAQATSYLPSTSASPSMRPYSSVNSPHVPEGYSPMATSPGSTTASFRDPHHAFAPGPPSATDFREGVPSTSPSSAPFLPPTSNSHSSYIPQHQGVYQSHPRRTGLDTIAPPPLHRADSSVPSVPSLVHTDTSASSPSLAGSRKSSYVGPPHPSATSLPSMDAPKSHRILPQPIASGIVHSPLDTPSPGIPTRTVLPPTTSSTPAGSREGWSALLMATDLMSNADRRPPPEDRPP